MPRMRTLKHGFFTNDVLAEVVALGRLLFAGLWTIADREGRLEDRVKKIKAEILPYDSCDVDELLNELKNYGFIIRYEARGGHYIQIVNFSKHQSPHVKEPPSTIPPPDEPATPSSPAITQDKDNTVQAPDLPDTSTVQAPVEPSGFMGSGFMGSGVVDATQQPPPDEPWQIAEYRTIYGKAPPLHGQEAILSGVSNREVWRRTLGIWRGNNHDPTKYGNIVDRYKRELEKANGQPLANQPTGYR